MRKSGANTCEEIRNPKPEIQNKSKWQKREEIQNQPSLAVF
jgi:hypothetical protein